MEYIKNSLLVVFLICNYNSFGQWVEIDHVKGRYIETLNFIDDDLGYALMNDDTGNATTIMSTVDGGANWMELNLPMQSGEFQDLYFYAAGKGMVVVRDLNNDMTPTRLFRTLDNGMNWEDISPETTATGVGVGKCQFLNQDIGFLVTDRFFYKTIDGGTNWTSSEFDEYILSIDFLDEEHGVMGTWDGTFNYAGGILTTSDGGLNWANNLLTDNYTSIGEVQQLSSSVALAAPVRSWAAIQAGQIYKTTDGGINWNTIEIPMPTSDYTLRQIDFKDEMNGVICVGDALTTNIYQTTNGGQNWEEEGVITSTENSDLQLTLNSGYISGGIGSFYKRSGSTSTREVRTEVDVNLFPSPTKSGQTINWNSKEDFTSLLIIDQRGRTIHQQSLTGNRASLPQLIAGIYFVQLLNEKVFTTTKLIVE